MRKRWFMLGFCGLSSILLVVALCCFSTLINRNPNGFIRLFPPGKIEPIDHLDIGLNSYYIGGCLDKRVYLANYSSPYILFKVDEKLKDTMSIKVPWIDTLKISRSAMIGVDSPYVFLNDGGTGHVLEYKLGKEGAGALQPELFKMRYNTGLVRVSDRSFVSRVVSEARENVLIKESAGGGTVKVGTGLLQKQVDGLFCTDGMLMKVPKSDRLLYLYYYRNQFICMDGNLNLIYRGRTIDTISHAQIKVAEIKSDHQVTLSAPPLVVNKQSCANEKYLFVNSALVANNENGMALKYASTIDVYALGDGKYQYSFYLPNFSGKKPSDFKVFGKTLVALYDHYICTYKLNI